MLVALSRVPLRWGKHGRERDPVVGSLNHRYQWSDRGRLQLILGWF